jgi:hypothetical protein
MRRRRSRGIREYVYRNGGKRCLEVGMERLGRKRRAWMLRGKLVSSVALCVVDAGRERRSKNVSNDSAKPSIPSGLKFCSQGMKPAYSSSTSILSLVQRFLEFHSRSIFSCKMLLLESCMVQASPPLFSSLVSPL